MSTHPIECFVPSIRVSTFLSHNGREVKGHLTTESVPQVSRWINLFLAINDILLLKDKQKNIRWANAWRFAPWISGCCAPACGVRSDPSNDQVFVRKSWALVLWLSALNHLQAFKPSRLNDVSDSRSRTTQKPHTGIRDWFLGVVAGLIYGDQMNWRRQ